MLTRLFKNVLVTLIFASLSIPAASQAADAYYYLINYQKPVGVLVTAKINGVKVVNSLNGTYLPIALNSFNLNAWVTSGTNTLSFTAKRAPGAKAPTSSTEIVISRVLAGQKANEGETLTYIVVTAKELKGTIQVEREFSVTTTPPSDFWPQAKPLQITPLTKVILTWEVYKIWQTITTKNVDKYFSLFKYQFDEINRFNFEQVYTEAEFKDLFLLPLVSTKLEPLPSSPLHFELLADKRIVRITDKTGHSPIKISTGEIGILIAPVNGSWKLVR